MAARFILSLDCEGKWGVADHLGRDEHRTLDDASLRTAYRSIVDLLDDHDIAATFAFVGLFGESQASFNHLLPRVRDLAGQAPAYLAPALVDIATGSRQGWHGEWAVDEVATANTRHEIALHGVTHVPLASASDCFVAGELELYRELSGPVGKSTTFVYPRNLVAHSGRLKEIGIHGYRLAPSRRSRARSLASEFNLLAQGEPDPPLPADGVIQIPAGIFVNWQHGPRRLVPTAVSERRLSNMISHADATDGVVHLWLHPENVASAPATLALLQRLLGNVARIRDAGRCAILTQDAYARQRLARSSNEAALQRSLP